MKVNTLFPSRSENDEVNGGVILLKRTKITNTTPSNALIKLTVIYENRNGQKDADEAEDYIPGWDPNIINKTAIPEEYYENNGIKKAILLSRYVNLMKSWLIEENSNSSNEKIVFNIDSEGITRPEVNKSWERTSNKLTVSKKYKEAFKKFKAEILSENNYLNDDTSNQEIKIIDVLLSV